MQERSMTRSIESNYLLTGLIVCGKCGAKMRYQKWGKHDQKIVCYSQDKNKAHLIKDPNCDNLKTWASELEDVVISDLFAFSFKHNKNKKDVSPKESVLEVLHRQYDEIAKKIKRLYHLYSESEDDLLLETIDENRKKLGDMQKQIDLEQDRNLQTNRIIQIQNQLSSLKEAWQHMSQKEKKNIIKTCIDKIIITDTNIGIFYKFKEYSAA